MSKKIDEFRRSSENLPIKDVIEKMLRIYNLESKYNEAEVINAWPELMGPAVAARTKSITIKGDKLYAIIDSSVMREELFKGKQIIIDLINQYAGKEIIKDIWFS